MVVKTITARSKMKPLMPRRAMRKVEKRRQHRQTGLARWITPPRKKESQLPETVEWEKDNHRRVKHAKFYTVIKKAASEVAFFITSRQAAYRSGQLSVRKLDAGSPALLNRLGSAVLFQA